MTSGNKAPQYRETISDVSGNPSIYVYTYFGDNGFLLLSAYDSAPALLGYSETNDFDTRRMSESTTAWVANYASQIAVAKDIKGYRFAPTRADDRVKIEPMVKTTWDQLSPYNGQCPLVGVRRSVTGCVATAMAQIMNYWKYPEVGQGEITYTPNNFSSPLSLDFSTVEFDWDNMLDSYPYNASSTDPSSKAVATLMKACGYAVKMNYSPDASGANSNLIGYGMRTYFGYDSGVQYTARSGYSNSAWDKMVYENLLNVGPLIYDGQSSTGGHSFVCDGYDGKGYYHINWGWGGHSDGYFLLDELTPSDIGTGGHYGGYNMSQDAVFGIMPPVGRLTLVDMAIDNKATDSGNVQGKGYIYRVSSFWNIQLSVKLKVSGGHLSSPLYVKVLETDPTTLKTGEQVYEGVFPEKLNLSSGSTATYSCAVNMAKYDVSKLYTLMVSYDLKGKNVVIGTLKFAASAPVESVVEDDSFGLSYSGDVVKADGAGEIALTVYDLQGRIVAEKTGETPEIPTDGLPKGLYVATARRADGATRTVKLHLK